MSLINDALKRASQSQKPPETNDGSTPLTPATPAPAAGSKLVPVLVVLLLVLLGGGGWMVWQGFNKQKTPGSVAAASAKPKAAPANNASNPSALPPRQPGTYKSALDTAAKTAAAASQVSTVDPLPRTAALTPTNLTSVATPPGPLVKGVQAAPATPVATASPSSGPVKATAPIPANSQTATPTAAAAAGSFPSLKLSGVFYRLSKPSVLINGRTLYMGETIEGAKVVKIERESATVEWNGTRRVLSLSSRQQN